MPSIKDLKKRIGTVKNTQQTTRAMKMVSAAKLRRAQEAIYNQRPYARRILDLIQELSSRTKLPEGHALLRQENLSGSDQGRKVLVVLVTSDRGLCGGFNGSLIKFCQRWMRSAEAENVNFELAFVGRKGHEFFKNRKAKIASYYAEAGGKVTFGKAKVLADALVDRYVKGEVDEIKIIYSEFKNAVTQKVMIQDFLPLQSADNDAGGAKATSNADGGHTSDAKVAKVESDAGANPGANSNDEFRDYIIKPSPQIVLNQLLSKNFAIQTFRILLESQAGEHGARMSAMENATKNAGEMIRKLTLLYNKQRQAGITKELLEIISGSESQKS